MDWTMLPVLLALGAVIGFMAGLLGIGGGMSIVPLLTILYTARDFPSAHVVHMAVGTATATMMFTALSSVRAHSRKKAVLWAVVAAMAPGIVLGSLAGPQIAAALPGHVLAAVFGVFTWASATRQLTARPPRPGRELPGRLALFGVGTGVGVVSSLLGAGGGFITIPYLGFHNVKIHNAVATSAALGLPIAVAGTISFVVAGLRQPDLPAWSVGYVWLPAMIMIVVASMAVAPVGVAMAHRWPAVKLRRAFAALLYVLGAYMFWKASRG
ncbi:MAG TPA: sulfite exporter TauE/SafE family protein [Casimicrobiaceae bacterium]|nr:sulfite exporter TauE/SafE family protein [Casimicrobiaceae bacterium]